MSKKHLSIAALVMYGIYAVYACVLAPLYQYLISDFVLRDTLWLDLVDLLFQYAEFFGFAAVIAFVAFALYCKAVREARGMLLLCAGAVAFKYLGTVIAISIINGSINLTGGLWEYLTAFLLELGLAAVALLLSCRLILPAVQQHRDRTRAAAVLHRTSDEDDPCFPLQGIFSRKNPAQRTLFWSMLIFTAWRLAAFVISDLSYGVAITLADIPVMLLYWVILILLPGFLAYLLSLGIFRAFARKEA